MKNRIKLCLVLSLCAILCMMFTNLAFSTTSEIAEIQAAIQVKGAHWIAGESWVTRLSPEERRKLLGENTVVTGEVVPDSPTFSDVAPLAIDWRNKDGHNWITPIRDQQSCGSCVAFGSVATLESLVRIEQNQPDLDIDLSEMHLFNCGGGSCSFGWYNSSACFYLSNDGTPDEACWPYQPVDLPCSSSCSDWESRAVKITSYGSISGIQAHMNYVAITPVLVSYEVYTDFYSYSGGIYEHTWGGYEGGHAVSIVGYDTTGVVPYWIVKNSWGPSWGESGYFRIKMGECNIENRSSYWMSGAVLPGAPDVSLSVRPDATNIPRGSSLGYWAQATNNSNITQCFYYWSNIFLPNGNPHPPSGEFVGPVYLCLSAFDSRSAHITHQIPMDAPLGTYIYDVFLGAYPSVWNNDSFDFTVTTTQKENGIKSWKTKIDEPF